MSTMSGFDGYIRVNENIVNCMRHWTITITGETLETSCFKPALEGAAKRFRTYAPGPLGWTASFDGSIDPTDAGQRGVMDAVQSGEIIEAYFHLDGTRYYVGKGILTSENPDMAWDGVGTISYDLQGSEPLVKVGWE